MPTPGPKTERKDRRSPRRVDMSRPAPRRERQDAQRRVDFDSNVTRARPITPEEQRRLTAAQENARALAAISRRSQAGTIPAGPPVGRTDMDFTRGPNREAAIMARPPAVPQTGTLSRAAQAGPITPGPQIPSTQQRTPGVPLVQMPPLSLQGQPPPPAPDPAAAQQFDAHQQLMSQIAQRVTGGQMTAEEMALLQSLFGGQ